MFYKRGFPRRTCTFAGTIAVQTKETRDETRCRSDASLGLALAVAFPAAAPQVVTPAIRRPSGAWSMAAHQGLHQAADHCGWSSTFRAEELRQPALGGRSRRQMGTALPLTMSSTSDGVELGDAEIEGVRKGLFRPGHNPRIAMSEPRSRPAACSRGTLLFWNTS
jgi:hypothetical protein